jgi:hypothetical protein
MRHFALIMFAAGLAFAQLPKPGGGVGGGGGGSAPYEASFSAATSVSVTAATHGKGVNAIVEACYDNATPRNSIAFSAGYPTVAANGDVVAQWSGAKTGKCYISAGDSGGTGPAGATGATGATGIGADVGNSGELIISQGTGVAPITDDGLAFDTGANSLGVKGNVTVGQTGTATGEIKINGTTSGTVTVKTADAAGTWTLKLPANDGDSGQFLRTDGAGVTTWAAGAGGGAAAFTDLTDSKVTLDTGTDTVTIAAGKVRVNGVSADCPATSQTLTSPTATTGTVWIACNGSTLTAYHDLTSVTGSGSVTVTGSATDFPADVIPIATCTVASNNFDTCTDVRAAQSITTYEAGTGLSRSGHTLSIGAIVGTFSSGTADPPGTCNVGETYIETDTNEDYRCTSPNTWTLNSGSGGSSAFNAITGGTNTTAAMVVGTGGSLAVSGSGTIAATTAATLATTRAIYGNNFDGSAALTQIIASTYGGTGNGFTKFSGPTTAEKTFTLPDASTTILTTNAAVTVAQGGTGIASGTSGGVPYFSGSTTIASSAALASGAVVTGGGAGAAPVTSADLAWDNTNKLLTASGASGSLQPGFIANNSNLTGATAGYKIYHGGALAGAFIHDKDTAELRFICSPNYASATLCFRAGVGGSQKSFVWGYNAPAPLANTIGFMTGGSDVTRVIMQASGSQSTTNVFEIRDYHATLGSGTLRFAMQADGTVSGSAVWPVANGGSGAATLTGILKGNGTSAFTAASAGTDYVSPSSTESLTNKTLDAEGTGNSITIPVKAWLPAAGCQNATASLMWDTPTSNPAVAACVTGTNTQKGVADFADSSNLSMQTTLLLPSDWSGAIDAKFKWLTSATTGSVVWQIATICVADAETDDPAFNTASTVTDAAKGTTLQTNDASITGVTATGCAAGELMHVKVFRDAAHASDDLAATARLIGVELTMRRAM